MIFLKRKHDNDNGFTLIEVIVVVVILAVLIGVTIAGITKYVGQARVNNDRKNADSIRSVCSTLYTDENLYQAAISLPDNKMWSIDIFWNQAVDVSDIPDMYFGSQGQQGSISGQPALGTLAGSYTTEPYNVGAMLRSLLPDGLPVSQTKFGFHMRINLTNTGTFSTLVETADDDISPGSFTQVENTCFRWATMNILP